MCQNECAILCRPGVEFRVGTYLQHSKNRLAMELTWNSQITRALGRADKIEGFSLVPEGGFVKKFVQWKGAIRLEDFSRETLPALEGRQGGKPLIDLRQHSGSYVFFHTAGDDLFKRQLLCHSRSPLERRAPGSLDGKIVLRADLVATSDLSSSTAKC